MTKKPNKLFAVFGIFAILVILTGVIFLVLALFFDKNENIEVSNEKNLTISKDFEIKFYDKDFEDGIPSGYARVFILPQTSENLDDSRYFLPDCTDKDAYPFSSMLFGLT